MLLRELYEAPKKVAVAAFGRMNPPTIGHEKLVEKLKSFNGDHYIFLSQTQKPKDNPCIKYRLDFTLIAIKCFLLPVVAAGSKSDEN